MKPAQLICGSLSFTCSSQTSTRHAARGHQGDPKRKKNTLSLFDIPLLVQQGEISC